MTTSLIDYLDIHLTPNPEALGIPFPVFTAILDAANKALANEWGALVGMENIPSAPNGFAMRLAPMEKVNDPS